MPLPGMTPGAGFFGMKKAGPPLDGLANLTGAWSLSRDLLTSFAGNPRYTASSGEVSAINDQTGNARHFTQGTSALRPVLDTAAGKVCATFDGSDDYMNGVAISNLITGANGYIIASCIPLTLDTNNTTNYFYNDVLFCDHGGYMGTFMLSTGECRAYNYSGGTQYAVSGTGAASVNNPLVMEWRHESGNIYLRVNGGTWFSAASGNTDALSGLARIGTTYSGAVYTHLKWCEMASFSAAPVEADRNKIAASFLSWLS